MIILLDTHVFVWMSLNSPELKAHIGQVIEGSAREDAVYVSPMTFWEIGLLESKNRLALDRPVIDWMNAVMAKPGLLLAPFSPEIALLSTRLPGRFHADPADRLIVATARATGSTLITHDRNILRYGEAGHVAVMAA